MNENKEYGKMRRQSGKASREKGGWKRGGDPNWGLSSLLMGETISPARRLCNRCKVAIPMDSDPKLCHECQGKGCQCPKCKKAS